MLIKVAIFSHANFELVIGLFELSNVGALLVEDDVQLLELLSDSKNSALHKSYFC